MAEEHFLKNNLAVMWQARQTLVYWMDGSKPVYYKGISLWPGWTKRLMIKARVPRSSLCIHMLSELWGKKKKKMFLRCFFNLWWQLTTRVWYTNCQVDGIRYRNMLDESGLSRHSHHSHVLYSYLIVSFALPCHMNAPKLDKIGIIQGACDHSQLGDVCY